MGRSWADVKAARSNTRVTVRIAYDSRAADDAERLDAELARVRDEDERHNRLPQAPALAERIQQLEQQVRDSEVEFTFEGLGRRKYQLLMEAHPATEAQEAMAETKLAYNLATFPPALMAACCVEPAELHSGVDEQGNLLDEKALAEWVEIHDEWSPGQVGRLWRACQQANGGAVEPPKSHLASVILATNDSARS